MGSIHRLLVAAGFASMLLLGCESTSSTTRLEKARLDFEAHRYESAHRLALDALKNSTGTERHDAAYLVGLSAYQLGHKRSAETHFIIASGSESRRTSGSAKAMLGIIREKDGQTLEAARYFKSASRNLSGSDARQAAQHAAMAYEAMGDLDSAETWIAYAAGDGMPSSDDFSAGTESARNPKAQAPSDRDSSTEFSIQAGAFRERNRAQRIADDLASFAREKSIGSVRIIPQSDVRGRELFVVQIGQFTTRQEATRARADLGRLEFIVTTTIHPTSATATSFSPATGIRYGNP